VLIEELRNQNVFVPQELEARTQEISRRGTVITQLSRRIETKGALQPASKEADKGLRAEEGAPTSTTAAFVAGSLLLGALNARGFEGKASEEFIEKEVE
jgi:hypothetical protein